MFIIILAFQYGLICNNVDLFVYPNRPFIEPLGNTFKLPFFLLRYLDSHLVKIIDVKVYSDGSYLRRVNISHTN